MKRFATLPLLAAVLFWFTMAPASADISGAMNQDEYNWIHTGGDLQNTRAEVVDHCNCTGVKIWDGTRFGNDAIGVRYATPSGADAYVYYVIRDGAKWSYAKVWCDDSGCHEGDV